MEHEKIEEIIEQLESIKKRPAMFLGKPDDVDAITHFLNGYHAAIFMIKGERIPILDDYKKIREQRGWEWNATSVAREMKEKSIPDKEIVQELITIEIEAWKIVLEAEKQS